MRGNRSTLGGIGEEVNLTPLERLRIEKAASDCGFEMTPQTVGAALRLRSARFPEWVDVELLGESVLRVSAPGSLLEKDGGVGSSTVTGFNELAATVPGKRITDLQVSKYKDLRGRHGQEAAAAKTGISVASARRLE